MPKATVNVLDTHHYDLKSLEGAFVDLRRMPYGKWLKRQEMSLRMELSGTGKNDAHGELAMANAEVTFFEFKECIADHNLEDDQGNKLNFQTRDAVMYLDPRVGNEIGQYIMELHEFDLPNSSTGSTF
jgi:hypothetical protein